MVRASQCQAPWHRLQLCFSSQSRSTRRKEPEKNKQVLQILSRLCRIFETGDVSTCALARQALKRDLEAVWPALRASLADADAKIRLQTLNLIFHLEVQDPRFSAAVVEVLQQDPQPRLRSRAAAVLAKCAPEQAPVLLEAAASDPDADVRSAASTAVAGLAVLASCNSKAHEASLLSTEDNTPTPNSAASELSEWNSLLALAETLHQYDEAPTFGARTISFRDDLFQGKSDADSGLGLCN